MDHRTLDAIALGTCYMDINVENFPFSSSGIVGEELIGKQYEVVPGGSAVNFCRHGRDLGLQTAFMGVTGDDMHGDTLDRLLTRQGVKPMLVRRSDLQTNIGLNIANPEGDHIMFVAGTANAALDPAFVMPRLIEALPHAKVLYLGGCLKLQNFAHAFAAIADLADQAGVRLVIDHGRVPQEVSQELVEAVKNLALRAAYYFPSREEFCALWNVSGIDEGLHLLHKQAPGLMTVVKDGAEGAFYIEHGAIRHVAAEKVKRVVNPTGAGDSFNAGVMTAVLKGRPLGEAVAYGCKVAAAKIKAEALPQL